MMQTSIGAHNHRSCRSNFRGKDLGDYDKNVLPQSVVPLPIRFRRAGYWTFNEGGKDDYNFEFSIDEFYDFVPKKRKGWGPAALVAGDCWRGKKQGQPFFGQVQLGGGKLGKRAATFIDRAAIDVPPYYPDIPEVREEIAHHYDCLLKTDQQVGEVIAALFYDLENDPHEIHNLAAQPEYAEQLKRHQQLLANWIVESGDQGQQPESDVGLLCALKRWGEKCVNPEYDRVRTQLTAE